MKDERGGGRGFTRIRIGREREKEKEKEREREKDGERGGDWGGSQPRTKVIHFAARRTTSLLNILSLWVGGGNEI